MRLLKWIFLFLLAVPLVVLALANNEPVLVRALPEDMSAWMDWSFSIELPLFVVIFAGVFAGVVIGYVFEYLRERHHRSEASRGRREVQKLQREVTDLKGRAQPEQDEVLALLDDSRRAS